MVKTQIPIAPNGIFSQCLSVLTSPHVPGSAPCPPCESSLWSYSTSADSAFSTGSASAASARSLSSLLHASGFCCRRSDMTALSEGGKRKCITPHGWVEIAFRYNDITDLLQFKDSNESASFRTGALTWTRSLGQIGHCFGSPKTQGSHHLSCHAVRRSLLSTRPWHCFVCSGPLCFHKNFFACPHDMQRERHLLMIFHNFIFFCAPTILCLPLFLLRLTQHKQVRTDRHMAQI